MKQRHFTQEAAETIHKLAASQGWPYSWVLDGTSARDAVHITGRSMAILQSQRRHLLAMARVLVGGEIYEPESPAERTWRKTGYVAVLMGLTTGQLISLVYRAEALGLTKPNLRTGKARWSELDIDCWLQYQKEGRLPLRK